MNRHQRLNIKSMVSIKDLTELFSVSEMTIRRDLALLSNDDVVELIPGGAMLKTRDEAQTETSSSIAFESTEKMGILHAR